MKPIVIDTSAVIAGFLGVHGAASLLVDAFFSDRLKVAYTMPVLREYAEVMERPKFAARISPSDRMALLQKLRASGLEVVPAPVPPDAWPDPDDLPFVAAALATEARVIVTFNPADFAPAARHGLRVLSPAEARREFL